MFANMTLILPLWVSHAVLSTGLMLLKLKLTKKYPSFWQGLRFPAVKKYTAAQLQAVIPLNEFGAICGEMEGGAIGHTCAANNVKFAVLRSISDGGDENSRLDYPTFKKIAAEISTTIILEFIKLQKNQYTLF